MITTQQQQQAREMVGVVTRVALVAPNAVQGTRREQRALARIRKRHPDARLFAPEGSITPAERRNRRGQIAWGHILDTADVVYVLPNADGRTRPPRGLGYLGGTIGGGCVENIARANRHGASIRLITGVEPFTCFYSTAPPAAPITILRNERGMFPVIEEFLDPTQVDSLFGDCLIVWDQTAAQAWREMGRAYFPNGLHVNGVPATLRQVRAAVEAELQRQLASPSMN